MSGAGDTTALLADVAHALESASDSGARVSRVLELLRRLVPHDRAALLERASGPAPRRVFVPDLEGPSRERLARTLEALLRLLDEGAPGALSAPPGSPRGHLAVPLVALDEVVGVLLVERDGAPFEGRELQLLSVIATQLGAYVAALRHEAEQGRARAELAEAARRRDQFLGLLSHELRNPLAPMGNALHLLQRADPAGEVAARARQVLERQFEQLSRLVDDLLDTTRVETGKVHLRRERLDLVALVQRTAEDHRSIFADRGISLAVVAAERELVVEGDAARLAQVVGNLLGNAAKFTDRGGHVDVAVARDGEVATVRVRDDGAGIPPHVLERLFLPFSQGDETLDRSRGGLGLGLALARGLVERHGGSIAARSDGAGRGAEFVVRLPLAAGAAPPARPPRAHDRVEPRRVLVVDDNLDAAETLRDLLALSGHACAVARDGSEAVRLAAEFHPDAVFCDIGLPGLSGYEVAKALRASAAPVPLLVAVTGYGRDEDRARALAAGFNAHLVKPVDLARVEALLAER